MNINYLDYQEDILKKSIDNNQPKVYVFDNFNNCRQARKKYEQLFLQKESIFLTMGELKEKLFPTDKLVVKEEKLSIIFYELLNEKERELFNIDNYFDVIDLANHFFDFYAELNEYNIEELSDLSEWQQQRYKILKKLRQRYIVRMEAQDYTDKTLVYDFKNYSPEYLRDYEKIVFVNIIDFTPKEKELVNRLEKGGKKVELYLQLIPADFDEQKLKLNQVTLPGFPVSEIELYHVEEKLIQTVNFILLLNEGMNGARNRNQTIGNYKVLDADFNNSNYHQLLATDKINIKMEIKFTQTKIYRFLNSLYDLLKNADLTGGNLKLEISDLLTASRLEEFRAYYNLSDENLRCLNEVAAKDYVYFTEELIGPGLEEYNTILADIYKINQYNSLREYCSFLENINLEKLNDRKYLNNISQYYDALLELDSIAEMNIVSSWHKFFSSPSRGLLRMIINYLRFKQVKKVKNDSPSKIEIEDLLAGSHCNRDNLIILNASRGVIPSSTDNGFLLNDNQRSKLGLRNESDKRREEKYIFFRHILSSKRVIIFSLKNLDNNVTTSSFVEELRLNYDLEINESYINAKNYPAVMKSIFTSGEKLSGQELGPKQHRSDKLKLEKQDFATKDFSLSYYKYTSLKDCYYRFYLQHIAELEEKQVKFDKKLSKKVLGIFAHDIFAKVIEEIKRNDFEINKQLIIRISRQRFDSYHLKINNYYLNYYRDILLGQIQDSIIYFLKKIKQKAGENIRETLTEWTPAAKNNPFYSHKLMDVYLSGRIDLLLKCSEKSYLIDFKTGRGETEQLDFYTLLLKPEISKDYRLDKSIYNIIEKKFKFSYPGSENKLSTKLKKELEQFVNSDQYSKKIKSRCKRCDYREICRVVVR